VALLFDSIREKKMRRPHRCASKSQNAFFTFPIRNGEVIMPAEAQIRLLRVLQEHEFERVENEHQRLTADEGVSSRLRAANSKASLER
jgi:hypothetical protein